MSYGKEDKRSKQLAAAKRARAGYAGEFERRKDRKAKKEAVDKIAHKLWKTTSNDWTV